MPLPHLATILLGLAAVVLAANQALKDAPKVRVLVPGWVKSPKWNYAPLILVVAAGSVFGIKSIYSESARISPQKSTLLTKPPSASPTPELSQLPSLVIPGSGNALSFGQQGGMTVGTLITQPPNRVLDQAGEEKLLSLLPTPSDVSSISIQVLAGEGSDERNAFAIQIQRFLMEEGYNVDKFIGWYMPLGDITPGVSINVQPGSPHLVAIAVNAQQ